MPAASLMLLLFLAIFARAAWEAWSEKRRDDALFHAVERKQRRLGVYEKLGGDVIEGRR